MVIDFDSAGAVVRLLAQEAPLEPQKRASDGLAAWRWTLTLPGFVGALQRRLTAWPVVCYGCVSGYPPRTFTLEVAMQLNPQWPGDAEHETLEVLFHRFSLMEYEFLSRELELDPAIIVLEQED